VSETSSGPIGRPWRRLAGFGWAGVAVVAALVGVVLALEHRSTSRSDETIRSGPAAPPVTWAAGARRAPDFRLRDQFGKPVSLSSLRGRPVIVTFIDPLCRNYCPLEAKQLNELVRDLPPKQRPAIVAVSVNVYGNARANLLQDVAKWRLVPEWRWGVGGDRRLASVWRRYQIGVLVTTKHVAGVTVHEVSHTEAAYVIDRNGYERALFLWPFRATDVRAALTKLSPA
jgi:cytochrome oxidase Cu insertion factor (SCO1/SenC/PrrC family)